MRSPPCATSCCPGKRTLRLAVAGLLLTTAATGSALAAPPSRGRPPRAATSAVRAPAPPSEPAVRWRRPATGPPRSCGTPSRPICRVTPRFPRARIPRHGTGPPVIASHPVAPLGDRLSTTRSRDGGQGLLLRQRPELRLFRGRGQQQLQEPRRHRRPLHPQRPGRQLALEHRLRTVLLQRPVRRRDVELGSRSHFERLDQQQQLQLRPGVRHVGRATTRV